MDSKTKPPFAFVSTDNECAIFSPDVAPVLVIPLPPVIVCTKLPVVCVPIVIKLFRLFVPVPPLATGNTPLIPESSILTRICPPLNSKPPLDFRSILSSVLSMTNP